MPTEIFSEKVVLLVPVLDMMVTGNMQWREQWAWH